MSRYKTFDEILDEDNTGDFDLPEERELEYGDFERESDLDDEDDEDGYYRNDDRYDSVDESQEWHDFDPDC